MADAKAPGTWTYEDLALLPADQRYEIIEGEVFPLDSMPQGELLRIHEAVGKAPATWTYDDLFSIPEDGKRYEIIEGVLHQLPSGSWDHATVVMNLIEFLLPVIDGMDGKLLTAPLDVFVPGGDPVIPDILALLPGSRAVPRMRGIEGPPDLVIEVVSPSNRVHDILTKNALYGRAGVREYWIVDPETRSVEILRLDRDALHTTQTATGSGTVTSPLLGAALALDAIFANVGDEAED